MDESRQEIKERVARTLETAEVSPKAMTALFLGLGIGLSLIRETVGQRGGLLFFLPLLTLLISVVLDAGFVLYCMVIRRGQRAEYLTLFDGFELSLKIALLEIVKSIFTALWSVLFVIPGLVASYRYSFALYNLLENPDIGVMQAISMSKRQTYGWKWRLFVLDLSYIPWYLLSSAATFVYNATIQNQIQTRMGGFAAYGAADNLQRFSDALSSLDGSALGIPSLGWTVIIGLWTLAVSVFYLAHYQCVALEYFEKAKRASGVGEGAAPWEREEFYER